MKSSPLFAVSIACWISAIQLLPHSLVAEDSQPEGTPFLKNVTPHFETIFFPDEAKNLILKVEKPLDAHRYEIRFNVKDFNGQQVTNGTAVVTGLNWCRLQVDIPRGITGWFRIEMQLFARGLNDALSSQFIDIAVVPHPVEVPPKDAFFAIADTFNSAASSPDLSGTVMEAVHRLGARWVRMFMGWESMQDSIGGEIDWSRMDRAFDATDRMGIGLLPMLGFTPEAVVDPEIERPMHRGRPLRTESLPPRNDEWIRFVREAAKRYHGRARAWEVWNEPNSLSFWPGGDADSYASHYLAAHAAIREQDADVRVVMGGLSGVKAGWIRRFANDEVAPLLSTINVHPYRYPSAPPELADTAATDGYGSNTLLEDLGFLKEIESRLGNSKSGQREIWITESGYNTMPGEKRPLHATIEEKDQAALLVRTMSLARAAGVKRYFWWRLFDTYGAGMGLLRNQSHNFEPKPAYAAYAVLANKLAEATECMLVSGLHEGDFAVRANTPNGSVIVAWSLGEDRYLTPPKDAQVRDIMGMEVNLPKGQKLALSEAPFYLESSREIANDDILNAIETQK